MLEAEGEDADRSMAAHRQAAAGLDEENPDVGVGAGGRIEKPAAHHVVPARLETQPGANPVEPLHEIEPALGHRCAAQQRRPARHQPHGIAGRVTVDAEERGTHYFTALHLRSPAGFPVAAFAATRSKPRAHADEVATPDDVVQCDVGVGVAAPARREQRGLLVECVVDAAEQLH